MFSIKITQTLSQKILIVYYYFKPCDHITVFYGKLKHIFNSQADQIPFV